MVEMLTQFLVPHPMRSPGSSGGTAIAGTLGTSVVATCLSMKRFYETRPLGTNCCVVMLHGHVCCIVVCCGLSFMSCNSLQEVMVVRKQRVVKVPLVSQHGHWGRLARVQNDKILSIHSPTKFQISQRCSKTQLHQEISVAVGDWQGELCQQLEQVTV